MFRKVVIIVSLFWFGYTLVTMTDVVADILPQLAWFVGGFLIFAVGLALVMLPDQTPSSRRPGGILIRWLPLLLLAINIALVMGGRGLLYRFQLSQTTITRYAHAVQAGKGYLPNSGMIGLFTIQYTELLPDGSVQLTTSNDGSTYGGFAYSPTAEPPEISFSVRLTPLNAHWWIWKRES